MSNISEANKEEKTFLNIAAVDIYHPETIRDNDYYLERFKENEKMQDILEKVGRNKRYVIGDAKENSLTMAINAAEKVLQRHGIDNGDVDIIIFASTTLEYLSPTNAMWLHSALKIKKECMCFDINANCLGMFFSIRASVCFTSI